VVHKCEEVLKKNWYLWPLLAIGVLIIAGGVYWLVSSTDNPKYSQTEVTALVKRDLTTLGISGHKIESVDYLSADKYAGKGEWQGTAQVSYSFISTSTNPFS
jgi:hypothetical protein